VNGTGSLGLSELTAVGPLDGCVCLSWTLSQRTSLIICSQRNTSTCRRYGSKVAALRQTFSEYGLIKFRVLVECRWLQQLAAISEVTEVPAFGQEATAALDLLASSFDVQDALAVKKVCHVCERNMAMYSCEQF